jgi:2-keto-3-deoxy-L-rhamnonate aldolase RhmA
VDPAALRALNHEIFVAVMIETSEALAKIDEICSLQGIDAVGLGHRDYALDAGLPDFALDQPGMQEALGKVNAAAKRHGKARYGSAATPEELQQSLADGALLFSLGRETKVWERTCNSVQALKTAAGL